MADVFVSYARTDKERVAPLVAAIESRGWTVWWDPDIAPGQEFDSQIEAELLAAGAVVVVWTPTSVGSRWVRGEAREAADRGILVPVRFDGARLPMDVRAIHTIDLDQWSGNTGSGPFQDLIRALEGMTRRTPGAGSQATAATSTGAQAAAPPRVGICVLPFANMSGDVEQEYFSDGISEDVITDLSKVSSLAVVSRNTAFNFKGKAIDIQQIARQLKVQYVLEGSVRRAGGRVRITAQLIEAATDNHVWAERYDRDLNDIFELQDEISQAIVKALRLRLLPEEKKAIEQRGTTNLEAYKIVLMARQHYSSGQMADARKSDTVIRLCRAAIELDPNYARAWALLASAQRNRSYGGGGTGENGLEAAMRALEIDGNLAEAHAAKAGALAAQGDYTAAFDAVVRALQLDGESADVNREAGRLAIHQRRFADAAQHFERAFDADESDASSGGMMITCYMALGDTAGLQRVAQKALVRAETHIQKDSTNGSVMAQLYSALLVLGQAERAKEWARRAMLMDPDNLGMRYNLACDTIVSLRDFDLALELLRPVFEKGGREQVAWFKADPDTEALRDDPRCQSMIEAAERRLGIAPATISPASA